MKGKTKRRIGSFFMAAAMAASGWPLPAYAAQTQAEGDLAVHYDMSHADGYLKDVSGNGNDAKLYRIGEEDFHDQYGDAYLKFPGTDGAYAELPASIKDDLNYREAFTVEMELIPHTTQNQFIWTIGTGFQTDYLFVNPRVGSGGMRVGIKTVGQNREDLMPNTDGARLSTEEYNLVTITSSGSTLKLYVNGKEIGTLNHSHNLDEIFSGNDQGVLGYLAKSNWNDPYSDASVTDFKIYNKTLSESEVQSGYAEMEARKALSMDADRISLPEYTLEDLNLPAKGESGSDITWKSSDPKVLSDDGKIQKTASENKTVTLTATFANADTQTTAVKTFSIYVITNGLQGSLDYLIERFTPGIQYVTEDIVLPDQYEGMSIEWTGNDLITKDGKVTRPDQDTEVTLKAVFSAQGIEAEKEYKVTVAGKTAGYLATYVAKYEHNVGPEFAEYPAHKYEGFNPLPSYDYSRYSDNARTDVMFYALSEDSGKTFQALNSDKAVLYPTGKLQMGSPSLFRKADGTYGAIASVNNTQPQIILWDSEDLLFFKNQRTITLNSQGIAVKSPKVTYDNASQKYAVHWLGGNGKAYVSRSKDLQTLETAEEAAYDIAIVTGQLPVYADVDEASVFGLTAKEMKRIQDKYGEIYSVDVDVDDVKVGEGEEVTLPDTVDVVYNDGSTKSMGVDWNTEDSGLDLKDPKKGTYTVTGTVKQEVYNSPLAPCRADPYAIYSEKDHAYYFTGSYMQADLKNPYSRLVIRKADTLNGLTNAQEVTVWDGSKGIAQPYYWAPELHYIGGHWRIIALSTINGWQMTIFTCNGDDPMIAEDWECTGVVKPAKNGLNLGAFDTTFFEYEGVCYYVSPSGGNIWITTFDPSDPLTPTSDLIAISKPTYSWEYNITTHQDIEEGSAVMIHDGKIYITYAASTVDMNYAVGLLYADLDDDIMDPASWTKYPYPVLATPDLTTTVKEPDFANGKDGSYKGTFGPGHNSLTVDQNGNPVIVYHARDWSEDFTSGSNVAKYGLEDPGRNAYAANIHFGADGFPIFNMTSEQELADDLKTVKVTVTVGKEEPTDLFLDVTKDSDEWIRNAVGYVHENGIMTGLKDDKGQLTGNFGPALNLSRGQFATILYRMAGGDSETGNLEPDGEVKNFPDVDYNGSDFYRYAVKWASSVGIIKGYEDTGEFGPGDDITREQMAAMMYRYAFYKEYTLAESSDMTEFPDQGKVNPKLRTEMGWAVKAGLITGNDNGSAPKTLDPQNPTSRAVCATIIQRFYEKVADR